MYFTVNLYIYKLSIIFRFYCQFKIHTEEQKNLMFNECRYI